MQLIFETENASELKQQVVDFCNVFGVAVLKIVPSEGIPETPKAGLKKKTRKKVEEVFEDVPPDVVSETPVEEMEEVYADETPQCFTREDVMAVLQTLNKEKGMVAAKELLGKFGAQRISEVQEKDFKGFIDEALVLINVRA